jgi:site-specific DNA-methyltransferase (adenine-specific)
MREKIRHAFLVMRCHYPPDRVVADPELNRAFVEECRRCGLTEPEKRLNQLLLNLRKGGDLKGLPRSFRTSFPNEEDYRFASEIAARYLERAKGVTVDEIICDPDTAREFDAMAQALAPGYAPLQYRWAALNLRKARHLKPEMLSRIAPAEMVSLGPVSSLDLLRISRKQGLYILYDPKSRHTLYVGEASNLRKRLDKHFDHSDNKGLARWLWENGFKELYLEVHLLPERTAKRVRRALEAELIESRRPLFNVQRP